MQSMNISSWSDFKALVTSKKLLMQYTEAVSYYDIFAPEDMFIWSTSILKGSSNGDDFENNFKANSNKPLEIRSSASRPPRVSASPQPDGTTEHWKGFVIECGAEDSSKYIDISFSGTIYLRGGTMYSDDVTAGDKFKAEVQVIANGYTAMTPMEDVYLLPSRNIVVMSPECMEMTSIVRLRVTFTPAQTGTAKKLFFFLDYYV